MPSPGWRAKRTGLLVLVPTIIGYLFVYDRGWWRPVSLEWLGRLTPYLAIGLALIFGYYLFKNAALIWRAFRSIRWRENGQCPECGYERRGLAADVPCPECGSVPSPK